MSEASRSVRWVVVGVAAGISLLGCTPPFTEQGPVAHHMAGNQVPVKLLGANVVQQGSGTPIAVSTDLADLQALIIGSGGRPGYDPCPSQPHRGKCWSELSSPPNTLFVATVLEPFCAQARVIGATLVPPRDLRVAAEYESCPRGFGSAAVPTLSVLGVPLAALPAEILTVSLDLYSKTSVNPETGETRSTLVDLRTPAMPTPSPAVRQDSVRRAVNAAEVAVLADQSRPVGTQVTQLAVLRTPAADTCARPSQADPIGAAITLWLGIRSKDAAAASRWFAVTDGRLSQCRGETFPDAPA